MSREGLVLVTGGLGFLGTHVVRAFARSGRRCLVVARRPPDTTVFTGIPDQVTTVALDLTDPDGLLALGDRYEISDVVHLAAPLPAASSSCTFARTAITALFTVLDAALAWGVTRLSVASSVGVYQGAQHLPYPEDARLRQRPIDPIPAVKNAGELLAAVACADTRMQVVNMRIATVWGPGSPPDAVPVAQLVHAGVRDRPATRQIHAEGGADLCHVTDCARAVVLCSSPLISATTPTTSVRVSRRAPARSGTPYAGSDSTPARRWWTAAPPDGPGQDTFLDITRLRQDTGYEPTVDLDDGVADYARWLQTGNER